MNIVNIDEMQDNIDFEMIKVYFKQSGIAACCALCLLVFLAFSFYQIAATKHIIIWFLLVFSVSVYIIYSAYRLKRVLPTYEIAEVKNRLDFAHVLAGLAWGSAYFFLMDAQHAQPSNYYIVVSLAVIAAFASSCMAASLRGLVGFIVPIAFLSTLFFLTNLQAYGWWFLGMVGLAGASLFFGLVNHQSIKGHIAGRLLNESYIDELKRLNEKIETTSKDFIQRNLELVDAQKKLQLLATHDELTGLHNRRYILDRISEKLPEIRRHQLDCCVVIMDVDHFKQVNDNYGHTAGDDVLRTTAQLLTRELRHGDVIARYGGEEFLILLPMTELASAQLLVERLRSIIEKQTHILDGNRVTVTASFGITQFYSQDTADKMIDRADKALYQAKMAGRNCVKLIAKPD